MSDQPSMEQSFLKKLYTAIDQNYMNEDFGVDELAHEIGISRSQLHRKLQAINGKSASQMIREHRLMKALTMLQEKVATVSEISFKVGFNSPSYFNTCFHEHFGYSPGKVKEKKATFPTDDKERLKDRYLKYFKYLIVLLLALLLITWFYFFLNSTSSQENLIGQDFEKSIAIIPFKNLSHDIENKYFADGMTDDLLNHLSAIEGLIVKSRQSSERYRDSDKTIPVIGKELGVSFILEGSVQRYQENIRVIIQLIDVATDDHIWVDRYDRELKDIFAIQSEISQQIAYELNAVLSPDVLRQIEKKPTENIEAYNLYQKGRFFWSRRTAAELVKSMDYFNQAIELDKDYALAYAGLADAYYIMVWWGWLPKNEGYPKAKLFVKKALDIDSTLAEAYATIGSMNCYLEYNWREAEVNLKKALDLNPNYATGHQYYSEFLDLTGNDKEARKQINLALKLNPLSIIIQMQSSAYYFRAGDYVKALEEGLKGYDLDKDRVEDCWRMIKTYKMLGMDDDAKYQLKKLWKNDSSTLKYVSIIDEVFMDKGIDGLLRWATEIEQKTNPMNAYEIAENYSVLGEKDLVIEWLEKASEYNSTSLPKINNNILFDNLRSDPRFIHLLEKINLRD